MKYKFYIFPILFIFTLTLLCISTGSADGLMQGFVSNNFSTETLNLNNGKIDEAWTNVTAFQNLTEFGDQGSAKFANNGTHLFALLSTSMSYEWISIEFDAETDNCMRNGHDGWVIYIDQVTNKISLLDISFLGSAIPNTDTRNDLQSEYVIKENIIEIEIVRPFDTADADGADIVFENSTVVMITFASNIDHYETRSIFYLSVQYYEGIDDGLIPIEFVPDFEFPVETDWMQIKTDILQAGVFLIGFFVSMHFLIREQSRPLAHGNRIVDVDFKPPTFTQRWNSIFKRKTKGEN